MSIGTPIKQGRDNYPVEDHINNLARLPALRAFTVLLLLTDDERGDASSESDWVTTIRVRGANVADAVTKAQVSLARVSDHPPEDYAVVAVFAGHHLNMAVVP